MRSFILNVEKKAYRLEQLHSEKKLLMSCLFQFLHLFLSEPIQVSVTQSQKVQLDETVVLECNATGTKPSIKWTGPSDAPFKGDKVTRKNEFASSTLTLTKISRLHSGVYTCEASNAAGKRTMEVNLIVIGEWTCSTRMMYQFPALKTNWSFIFSCHAVRRGFPTL